MYDYERWLSGKFAGKTAAITPQYLLEELGKLEAHIAMIDVYRMNKQLLHEYLLFLLQDEKIGIVQLKASPETLADMVATFLRIIILLPPYYAKVVLERLLLLPGEQDAGRQPVEEALQVLARRQRRERWFPWLALLLTIALCICMYLFAHR